MYPHSANRSPSSYVLEKNQNNLEQWDWSLEVSSHPENLLFLAQILQENLRAEVPSGEFLQVKCAINNNRLMVLTQHPKGVQPDAEKIFVVLEEILQLLPVHQDKEVELFLRVSGHKLPYAKYSLTLKKRGDGVDGGDGGDGGDGEEGGAILLLTSATSATSVEPVHQVKPLRMGVALVLMTMLGCAGYFLTRPCVMLACQEIQMAKQLQRSFGQMTNSPRSEQELVKWQQQFNAVSASLTKIPHWSLSYQETEQLSASLFAESEKMNQVVKAFERGSLAAQQGQTAALNLEELQDRQQLWQQVIAPLEAISFNSPLYGLVQQKLWLYRTNLRIVTQQLFIEEKWLKKLEAAKAVAQAALARETSAKSLQDWQKVESNWLLAVNVLSAIPQNSLGYQEAQKLLAEYKPLLAATSDRTTQELLATKIYNQAINAANLATRDEQQNQWQAAVAHRSFALNAAQQVSNNTLYYSQAQSLIQPYSTALKQAKEKLQATNSFQQTRADLDKTCSGEVRVCNFAVDNQGIAVWITPEYEQILSSNLMNNNDPNTVASVTNHLQTLKQAVEAISENSSIYVVLYDTQGKLIYSHIPGR